MQKLEKTFELISSLLLNMSHVYIKVQPEERSRYKTSYVMDTRATVVHFSPVIRQLHFSKLSLPATESTQMTSLCGTKWPECITHYSLP